MELDKIENCFYTSKYIYQVNSDKKSNDVFDPEESKRGLKEPCIKSRYLVLIFLFMTEFVYYYQQMTMSVSLVAMVNQSSLPHQEKFTNASLCPPDNTELKNNSTEKIAYAGITPSITILISNWFPKQERAFAFTCVMSGCGIGAFFGSYLSGLLCDTISLGGWPSAFYVSGAIGFTLSMVVLFIMHDNPSVHPRITQAEREYIFRNQENILTEKRPKTPWKELLTSVPVYALGYAYFGQIWAASYFISVNPTYLSTILHYSTEKSGLMSSLSYTLTFTMVIACSFLSKFLTDKNYMTVNYARKFWNSLSCLGMSLSILGIYLAECNKYAIIVISIFVSLFFGTSCAGCWVVCSDMSPTFSASINSIGITIGNFGYIILPVTVGYLTDGAQTMEQWHKIFIISIAINFSSGLVFAIFGSGKLQPWNDVPKKVSGEMNEKKNCRPEQQ